MQDLTSKIDELFAQNRGKEAEALLESCLKEALQEGRLADAVPILNELIGYCRETSQVEKSYDYADLVLKILDRMQLQGTIPYATTLLNIANAYRAGGRLEDSLNVYEHVLEIYRQNLKSDDMLFASLHNNMSLLYQEMGSFDLAKAALLKALAIVEQKEDAVFEVAVTYANLAATDLSLGLDEEAEVCFNKAIKLFESNHILDTHYCAALSALATFYYRKGNYREAEKYFRKAMEGIEAHLGQNEYYQRMKENAELCRQTYERASGQEREEAAEDVDGQERAEAAEDVDGQEREEAAEDVGGQEHEEAAEAIDGQGHEKDTEACFSKGLDICRAYYETYGKPMLEKLFPEYIDKIAVGLVGEGSDCFGYDDEISRDHDWGPSFNLWVTDETYEKIGRALQEAYEALPREFMGYEFKVSSQGQNRRGVHTINHFYQKLLGVENFPECRYLLDDGVDREKLASEENGIFEGSRPASGESGGFGGGESSSAENMVIRRNKAAIDRKYLRRRIEWEYIEDSSLAAAVNGEVFADPEGIFTEVRSLLREEYPARLRYLRMAEGMARFCQNGQYNVPRVLLRGDRVTAHLLLGEAVKEALKLLYYVDGEFPPHDKWLLHGLKRKGKYPDILELLERAVLAQDGGTAAGLEASASDNADKAAAGPEDLASDKTGKDVAGPEDLASDHAGKAVARREDSASHKEGGAAAWMEAAAAEISHLLYREGYISDTDSYLDVHVGELLFKAGIADLETAELAEKIARLEFEAFDKVKNLGGRADCQDDWSTFSIMRMSQYLTWTKPMLMQYYYDFSRELERGHNLIEEKYGRMMESTAPEEYEAIKSHFPAISLQKKEIIETIVGFQVKWMEEFAAEYPYLAGNARSIHTYEDTPWNTSYETYLRGEISTYSDRMLELYGRYIVEFSRTGENPAKKIMEQSVLLYGYEGLEEAEAGLRKQS